MRSSVSILAAAALLAGAAACSKPAAPADGPAAPQAAAPAATLPGAELAENDPARAAIKSALDARLTAELGVPAQVRVEIMRQDGDWAFASGPAVSSPAGEEIDFHATKLRERAEAGVIDGPNTLALLKREGGAWTVVEMAVGPTDVAQIEWVSKHGVPNALVGLEG